MTSLVSQGGAPDAFDRLLGTRFGVAAIESLKKKEYGVLVGLVDGEVRSIPLREVVSNTKPLDLKRFDVARILAR